VIEGVQYLHARLQELEGEVAQIQINMQNILRILMIGDQLDLTWCLEDFLSSFELLLRHFTIILVILDSRTLYLWFLILLFTLYPFETKMCRIFNFWTGIVFLIGQVNFIPKWPNGEFVSFIGYILLTKSLPY
jgi:hypothetical protein